MKAHSAMKKAKTLNCVLCRGLVAYTKEDRERFDSHMTIEHGVSENMNYILAGCLMNQDERDVVAAIIEDREGTTSLGLNNGKEVNEKKDIEAVEEVVEEAAGVEKEAELGVVKSMSCEECGEKFMDKRSLWLHKKSNHRQVKNEEPKRKRASGVKKEEEPVKKKGKKAFEQEVGDEEDKEATLNEEVVKKMEEGVESVPKGTTRKLGRSSKEMKDLDEEEKKSENKCEECLQEFKDQKGLTYHMFREHGGIKPLEEEDNIGELFPSPSVKRDKKSPKSVKSLKVKELEVVAKTEESPDVEAKQVEKQRVLKESEYFSSHPNEITVYTSKDDQTIKDDEYLPPDWMAVERTTISGRKIMSFVSADKMLSFRSRVGVFEYLRFTGLYSEAELETYSKMVKTRKSI